MKNKKEKRSPLKDRPLHLPGQSIDEQIQDKLVVTVYSWIIMPLILIILTAAEWRRYFHPSRANPIPATVLTIGMAIWSVFQFTKNIKEIKRLVMARDGEKIVAEELQVLLRDGSAVFHDIVSDRFNIDHVIVSGHGIFLIETKTYSKPIDKDAKISFDENHIFVDGEEYDRNPVEQVKALAKWLQDLLQKSTGVKFQIQPVVLFPGWFTEPMKRGQDVWILNPKALPTFVSNEPIRLKDTEVHLVTFHLSRYVRTFEPKR